MPTEQQKADLSKKRGQAAASIQDPETRRKFISAQGEAEQKGKGTASPEDYEHLDKSADETLATGGMNTWVKPLASYKRGTKSVPKTGAYKLHEGEKVVPEKNNPDSHLKTGEKKMATPFDMITAGAKKAPKTIQKHEYSKTHNGKHVVTHKHHSPEHKDEQHMFEKFSDAADHMEQNPPQPEQEMPQGAPAAGAPGAAPAM
jgi:hypothetical protein